MTQTALNCTDVFDFDGVKIIKFKNFEKYRNLKHAITTRCGGVSTGECASLNMSFGRKDERSNVEENFKRVCKVLDIEYEKLVFSNQIHGNKIWQADEKDRGKGIVKASDIVGYDGFVTNKAGIALVTFFADCVPVILYDPYRKAVASLHSGWKGTLKGISIEGLIMMKKLYGSNPDDIEAGIGPAIGKCCFEVQEDVASEFLSVKGVQQYVVSCGNKKWKIDLKGIIGKTLIENGVKQHNICTSELCTMCEQNLFFSHRRDHGKTGSMAAIVQLV